MLLAFFLTVIVSHEPGNNLTFIVSANKNVLFLSHFDKERSH